MSTLSIDHIDPALQQYLEEKAAQHHRSVGEEAAMLLSEALIEKGHGESIEAIAVPHASKRSDFVFWDPLGAT